MGKHALVSVALGIPSYLIIPDLHKSPHYLGITLSSGHQLPHVGCRGLGPASAPPLLTQRHPRPVLVVQVEDHSDLLRPHSALQPITRASLQEKALKHIVNIF